MPPPITGPVTTGKDGITIVFQPPMEFIARQVGEFRNRLLTFNQLWDRFEHVLPEILREHFETAGHGEWPPLAEATLAQKSRLGFPADPLVRSGDLKGALLNPGVAADRGPRHFAWGVDVEYARYHQTGDGPPKREVIPDPMRVEDRRKLERELVGWINSAAARSWRTAAA